MKKRLLASLFFLLLAFTTPAMGDSIPTGMYALEKYSVFDNDFSEQFYSNGTPFQYYPQPMQVLDLENGDSFIAFRTSFGVRATPGKFDDKTVGQEYQIYDSSKLSIVYGPAFALIDYTYGLAFATDGSLLNAEVASAIQLALWEYTTETSADYDVSSGNFAILPSDPAAWASTIELANSYLAAIRGDIHWENDLGYTRAGLGLTVYSASESDGNGYSSFIGVRRDPATPTPEPASFLLLGAGGAALFFYQRKKTLSV